MRSRARTPLPRRRASLPSGAGTTCDARLLRRAHRSIAFSLTLRLVTSSALSQMLCDRGGEVSKNHVGTRALYCGQDFEGCPVFVDPAVDSSGADHRILP